MEEIWRNIEDYPNYQVSSLGRVKSKERYARTHIHNKDGMRKVKEIILKPTQNRRGYLRITLFNKNGRRQCFVHRLVAQAFINNAKNLPAINHKDENKLNNCVDNLEWCDNKYNNNYGTRGERISKTKIENCNRTKPVICIELNKIFSSIMEAQRQLNIGNSHISRCCLGKEKTAGGYHWKYFKKMNKEDKKIFDEHIKKIKEIIKEENELKLKLETLQNKKLEHINFLLKEN